MLKESDLHKYQIQAKNHVLKNTHGGLFLEMGLGKTVITLSAINELLFRELDVTKVLVIAPKRVAETVWSDEIENWEHLQHLKITKVAGTPKQRAEALKEDSDIFTLGRDNVIWFCEHYGTKKIPFDMLVIDELSSFKNNRSKRFRNLRKLQPQFKRVVGLTGTPAPNGLIDLWSQMFLLDRGERLGKFITHYREDYFRPGKRNGAIIYSWDLKQGSEERIHEKISDICVSMKSEDYIELPGRIDNIIKLKMPEPLRKKYDDFEKEMVLEILEDSEVKNGDVEITALNAAALSNKLLQFANGAVYDEEKNYHEVHKLKIEATKDILEDANGKPVLIAWTYRHDLYRLQKELKQYDPRELKTEQDIRDWNAGKIKVLLTHPASSGHGLNLQAGGNIIVWFGQTWSLELEQQLNARLIRQGQRNVVIVNKLVTSKTHEENVISSQKKKDQTQNDLMTAVKATIKKYMK